MRQSLLLFVVFYNGDLAVPRSIDLVEGDVELLVLAILDFRVGDYAAGLRNDRSTVRFSPRASEELWLSDCICI